MSDIDQSSQRPSHVTFAHDIRHFFTAKDVNCMEQQSGGRIKLNDYASVKHYASQILGQIESGNMPPADSGEPKWSHEKVRQFKAWVAAGSPEH